MNSTSFSINPSPSPPFLSTSTATSSSLTCSYPPSFVKFQRFQSVGAKPINSFGRREEISSSLRPKIVKGRKGFGLQATSNMTITEFNLHKEEEGGPSAPLLDSENNSRPRRIALFVEPSPFA